MNTLMVNDLNNQQDATNFSFINFFNSALHVSGDKFAHPQEHILLYIQLLVQCTDTVADRSAAMSVHCTKLYIQSKSAPEDGRICGPKHVGLN